MLTWILEKWLEGLEVALPASSPQNTTPTPTKSTRMSLANLNPKSLGPSFDSLVAHEMSSSHKINLLSAESLFGDEGSDGNEGETLEKGQASNDVNVESKGAIASEPHLSPNTKKQLEGHICNTPSKKEQMGLQKDGQRQFAISSDFVGDEEFDGNDGENLQKGLDL